MRTKGALGLGKLMPLGSRVDPLVTELVTGAGSGAGGVEIQGAMLEALVQVLAAAGDRLSPARRRQSTSHTQSHTHDG